jgi:hypothetical protein
MTKHRHKWVSASTAWTLECMRCPELARCVCSSCCEGRCRKHDPRKRRAAKGRGK